MVTLRNSTTSEPTETGDPETIERMQHTRSALDRFARFLNAALDKIAECPPARGRQVWLGSKLGVSQKAARKWLVGEAFPESSRAEAFRRIGVDLEAIRSKAWAQSDEEEATVQCAQDETLTRHQGGQCLQIDPDLFLRMIALLEQAFRSVGRAPSATDISRATLRAYPLWAERDFSDDDFVRYYSDFLDSFSRS